MHKISGSGRARAKFDRYENKRYNLIVILTYRRELLISNKIDRCCFLCSVINRKWNQWRHSHDFPTFSFYASVSASVCSVLWSCLWSDGKSIQHVKNLLWQSPFILRRGHDLTWSKFRVQKIVYQDPEVIATSW